MNAKSKALKKVMGGAEKVHKYFDRRERARAHGTHVMYKDNK